MDVGWAALMAAFLVGLKVGTTAFEKADVMVADLDASSAGSWEL